MVEMLRVDKKFASPMPENSSTCGVCIAPAARITSRLAKTVLRSLKGSDAYCLGCKQKEDSMARPQLTSTPVTLFVSEVLQFSESSRLAVYLCLCVCFCLCADWLIGISLCTTGLCTRGVLEA